MSARKRTSPRKKKASKKSRTGSSQRFFVRNGSYFAIPSKKVGMKSYKLPLRFDAESTYRSTFRRNLFTKTGKKKLVKYTPNALRNRVEKKHLVGSTSEKKKYWNASQIVIGDPANERTRFRTINRVTFSNTNVKLPTGFSNPNIIASKTSWMKKRQAD